MEIINMGILKQLKLFSHMQNKDGMYYICNATLTKSKFNQLIRYWNLQYPNYQISLIK